MYRKEIHVLVPNWGYSILSALLNAARTLDIGVYISSSGANFGTHSIDWTWLADWREKKRVVKVVELKAFRGEMWMGGGGWVLGGVIPPMLNFADKNGVPRTKRNSPIEPFSCSYVHPVQKAT